MVKKLGSPHAHAAFPMFNHVSGSIKLSVKRKVKLIVADTWIE